MPSNSRLGFIVFIPTTVFSKLIFMICASCYETPSNYVPAAIFVQIMILCIVMISWCLAHVEPAAQFHRPQPSEFDCHTSDDLWSDSVNVYKDWPNHFTYHSILFRNKVHWYVFARMTGTGKQGGFMGGSIPRVGVWLERKSVHPNTSLLGRSSRMPNRTIFIDRKTYYSLAAILEA